MTSDNAGRTPVRPVVLPYAGRPDPIGLSAKELYAQVRWFRRTSFSNALMLIALACWLGTPMLLAFPSSRAGSFAVVIPAMLLLIVPLLALLVVCVIVLTGPIYLPKARRDGRLKTWGVANKVVAALLLAGWGWMFIRFIRAIW